MNNCKMCGFLHSANHSIRVIYEDAFFRVIQHEEKYLMVSKYHGTLAVNGQAVYALYLSKFLFGDCEELKQEYEDNHSFFIVKNPEHTFDKVIFSVITPVRTNHTKGLSNLFAFLEWQSFKDFEHIVIEDGRLNDNVSNLVKQQQLRQNTHIEFLQTDATNGWGNIQRDVGIQRASGKYIVFIDDDDIPMKCWLEQLYELRTDLLIYGAQWANAPANRSTLPDKPTPTCGYISTQNICVATDYAKRVGWPKSEHREADFTFVDRLWELDIRKRYDPRVGIIINGTDRLV